MAKSGRNENGSLIVTTATAALMIILPLGLYAFEVARAQLAACQLKVATDSAALAAANFLKDTDFDSAVERAKAKEKALLFLRRNLVTGVSLENASQSKSVQSDNPASGKSSFDLIFNKDHSVTAIAAFGLQPAFSSFLGINSVPVRVNSSAGTPGLEGDIAVVVDLSGSMAFNSQSVTFVRHMSAGKLLHTIKDRSNTPPAFGTSTHAFAIPDPNDVDFSKTKKMQSLQNAPYNVKLAAIIEAKLGNLENSQIYEKSNADKSEFAKSGLQPGPGYQEDYQRLALTKVQPLADEKDVLAEFVGNVSQNPDAHFSLVTYSSKVSDSEGQTDFSKKDSYRHPEVNLNKEEGRSQEVLEALAPSPAYGATNTGGAVLRAIEILNGKEHREGVSKTILLLTDGAANTGPSVETAALAAKKSNVKLMAVGFFHNSYALTTGKPILYSMVAKAGNGSKAFVAPNIPTLKEMLASISQGDVSLINR